MPEIHLQLCFIYAWSVITIFALMVTCDLCLYITCGKIAAYTLYTIQAWCRMIYWLIEIKYGKTAMNKHWLVMKVCVELRFCLLQYIPPPTFSPPSSAESLLFGIVDWGDGWFWCYCVICWQALIVVYVAVTYILFLWVLAFDEDSVRQQQSLSAQWVTMMQNLQSISSDLDEFIVQTGKLTRS